MACAAAVMARLRIRPLRVDLVAEEHIGGDAQMRAEHDFLMDRVDAARNGLRRVGELERARRTRGSRRRSADTRRSAA